MNKKCGEPHALSDRIIATQIHIFLNLPQWKFGGLTQHQKTMWILFHKQCESFFHNVNPFSQTMWILVFTNNVNPFSQCESFFTMWLLIHIVNPCFHEHCEVEPFVTNNVNPLSETVWIYFTSRIWDIWPGNYSTVTNFSIANCTSTQHATMIVVYSAC